MEKDNSERIVVLETKLDELQRQHRESEARHRDEMVRVFAKLDGIKADIAVHTQCPAPGKCNQLDEDIKELTGVVKTLEADLNKRVGERGIIAVICTLVGVGIAAILNKYL